MTDYRSLNDGTEITHGLATAALTFSGFDDELAFETNVLLAKAIHTPLPAAFYVACFSMLLDSKKQWMDYASKETGGAIVIDPLGFLPMIALDPVALNVTRVAYRDVVKKGLFLKMAVIADELVRFDVARGNYMEMSYLRALQIYLPQILPMCKGWSYRFENEVRLLVIPELSTSGVASGATPRARKVRNDEVEYLTTRQLHDGVRLPIVKVVLGSKASNTTIERVRAATERLNVPIEYFRGSFPCA
jgi:hypothetical protein